MKKLIFALACFVAVSAHAQYVTVQSTSMQSAPNVPTVSGTIYFSPVNNNGVAISYRVGTNGGQVAVLPSQATITNGAFTIQLADTALTSPVNVCYSVRAIDNVSRASLLGPGFTCLQPTQNNSWCSNGICSLDEYTPNLAALAVTVAGPPGPTGPQGPQGPAGEGSSLSGTPNQVVATDPTGSATDTVAVRHLVAADLPSLSTTVNGQSCPIGGSCTVSSTPSGTQNQVYATPNGSSGSAGLRALVATDLPTIPYAQLSGTPTIPTTLPPSGAAGGGLGGTYPNPTVLNINGVAITGTPSSGNVPIASGPTSATWAAIASSNGATIISQQCGTTPNCFQAYADAKVALTAAYTAFSFTGGTTPTTVTTNDNDSLAEYYIDNTPGPISMTMTPNATAGQYVNSIVALVTNGTGTLGQCWGINNQTATATTQSVSISPVGGPGHGLVAWSRVSQGTSIIGITFSDNSGLGNTYIPINPYGYPNASINSSNISAQMAIVQNVAGGTYTLTGTNNSTSAFRSIFACEISGLASSNVLNASGSFSTLTTNANAVIPSAGVITTVPDILFMATTVNSTTSTISSGTAGQTTTVTSASTDPAWTSADVGKAITVGNNCDGGNGYQNCFNSFPPGGGVISVNSAHSINVSVIPIVNSTSASGFSGWFVACHDDGAQVVAAWNNALANTSGQLLLPANGICISQPPFLSSSAGSLFNPSITGVSESTSVLIPMDTFNFGLCTTACIFNYPSNNFSGFGALFQNPFLWGQISNFSIWGAGYDGLRIFTGHPMFIANMLRMNNIEVAGWLWSTKSGANSVPIVNAQGIDANFIAGWGAGSGGLTISGGGHVTYIQNTVNNCFFGVQSSGSTSNSPGLSLNLTGGILQTNSCQFLEPKLSTAAIAANVNGGYWTSIKDVIGSVNVAQTGSVPSIVKFIGSNLNYFSSFGLTQSGGNVSIEDTQIDKLTLTGGNFYDGGNNYTCSTLAGICGAQGSGAGTIAPWTTTTHGITITAPGTISGPGSSTGILALASNFGTLDPNWGTGATVTTLTGNNTPMQMTLNNGSASVGASPVLTYTFPVPYPVAPIKCSAIQSGGTNAIGTFTTGTPTATSVPFTYSLIPTPSDTEVIQITCDYIK